jgi:peptide methionine sulfoxide reductase MsrB
MIARRLSHSTLLPSSRAQSPKAHGTSAVPVQEDLRWNCDRDTADRICNFNRHYAEHSGYFEKTNFIEKVKTAVGEINFYDSNSGKLLFTAPKGRSLEEFLLESRRHGWPSFRDAEVNWDYVRVLADGECVSVDGTHLGHNLPDRSNRYCINLVSVAGQPAQSK